MGFRERRAAKKAQQMAEEMQQDLDLGEVLKQAEQIQAQVLGSAGEAPKVDPGTLAQAHELAAELSGAKFKVRFGETAYGPGDTVEGVLVASEPIKARDVSAELRYVDESSDYVEGVAHASTGSLHSGDLDPDTELRFSLELPADALPDWPPAGSEVGLMGAGPGAISIDTTSSPGRLYWALVIMVDVPRRRDIEELHQLPLSEDRARWGGPEPSGGEGEMKRVVKGWDVEIEPDRWALRRGAELTATVEIGKPASDRENLRIGLVCEAAYDVQETSTDADGNTTTHRKTSVMPVFEDWPAIDSSAPSQQVRLRVPEDAPFSYRYAKGAFGHEWKVVAREDKRMRRDPRREATIQVAP